jgi:hypothetical protein
MKRLLYMVFLACAIIGNGYAEDRNRPPADYQGPTAEQPKFTKGDRWEYTRRGKVFSSVFIEERDGKLKFVEQWKDGPKWIIFRTTDLNFIKTLWKKEQEVKEESKPYKGPFSFPLWVGNKWSYEFRNIKSIYSKKAKKFGGTGELADWESDVKVVAYEQVKVPAGTFWAFKIKEVRRARGSKRLQLGYHITTWYSPEVKNFIKIEEEQEVWNRELIRYTLMNPN